MVRPSRHNCTCDVPRRYVRRNRETTTISVIRREGGCLSVTGLVAQGRTRAHTVTRSSSTTRCPLTNRRRSSPLGLAIMAFKVQRGAPRLHAYANNCPVPFPIRLSRAAAPHGPKPYIYTCAHVRTKNARVTVLTYSRRGN